MKRLQTLCRPLPLAYNLLVMAAKTSLTPLPGACAACAVRPFALFRVVPQARVGEIARVRSAVRLVRSGDAIRDTVFTLYAGWAFSWTTTPDGRRQILDFHLPGDLVERSEDGAEVSALTDASFCVLAKDRLCEFMGRDPGLAMSYADGLVRDRARLRERLTSLGRRDAMGRVAHLLLELHTRLSHRGGADRSGAPLPLKQGASGRCAGPVGGACQPGARRSAPRWRGGAAERAARHPRPRGDGGAGRLVQRPRRARADHAQGLRRPRPACLCQGAGGGFSMPTVSAMLRAAPCGAAQPMLRCIMRGVQGRNGPLPASPRSNYTPQ
ncbi:CRP-like cAMP-binding protein [Pseudoroseomonas cervicalis]|nr:CRP-like cAMP-binding protein [Pseudoroseomonas cervicalis]